MTLSKNPELYKDSAFPHDTHWIKRADVTSDQLRYALIQAVKQGSEQPSSDCFKQQHLWIGYRTLFVIQMALYSPIVETLKKALHIDSPAQLGFDLEVALREEGLLLSAQSFLTRAPTGSLGGLIKLAEIDLALIWPEESLRPAQDIYFSDLEFWIDALYPHQGETNEPIPVRLSLLRSDSSIPRQPLDPAQPSSFHRVVLTIDHENPSFLLLQAPSRSGQ